VADVVAPVGAVIGAVGELGRNLALVVVTTPVVDDVDVLNIVVLSGCEDPRNACFRQLDDEGH